MRRLRSSAAAEDGMSSFGRSLAWKTSLAYGGVTVDQIAQAFSQSITRLNEIFYVCVIYDTKISFFSKYDVEQSEPPYRDLVSYYPIQMGKDRLERDMGAVVHFDAQNDIYACKFDLRNKESYAYTHTHACFIEMSTPAGPIDLQNEILILHQEERTTAQIANHLNEMFQIRVSKCSSKLNISINIFFENILRKVVCLHQ
jgi:hypothetical protein